MTPIEYSVLDNSQLLNAAIALPNTGILKVDPIYSYCYLKVHDDFIHTLFPMIGEENIQMPDYFSERTSFLGAHISLVYPNESKSKEIKSDIMNDKIDHAHSFQVVSLIKAKVYSKIMVGLVVDAPSLEQIRKKYGLSSELNYNGVIVPFHITLAWGNDIMVLNLGIKSDLKSS